MKWFIGTNQPDTPVVHAAKLTVMVKCSTPSCNALVDQSENGVDHPFVCDQCKEEAAANGTSGDLSPGNS